MPGADGSSGLGYPVDRVEAGLGESRAYLGREASERLAELPVRAVDDPDRRHGRSSSSLTAPRSEPSFSMIILAREATVRMGRSKNSACPNLSRTTRSSFARYFTKRSEERRVGKECLGTFRLRCAPDD